MFKTIIFLMITLVVTCTFPVTSAYAIPERGDTLSDICFQLDDSTNTRNARLAATIINGTIVQSMQEFSFNRTVGKRTTDKGFIVGHFPYRENGKIIDGSDVGSGVCRTSTGVHLAALQADLKITEAHRHYIPVGYVKYGEDAAVNWPDTDMRFINNQVFPIKIMIMVDSENILRAQIIRAK